MKKESQLNLPPKMVAEQIANIVKTILSTMSPESRMRAFPNLRGKLDKFNPSEMSQKRSGGGAAIGTSISIIKNILNGKDPYYIQMVIKELQKRLV